MSEAAVPPSGGGEWRRGYPVVIGGISGMVAQAVGFLSLGTLMTPLVETFGWSRTEIVVVAAFAAALSPFIAPVIGWSLDRFGPRRIALIGIVLYPATLALAGLTGPSISSWWAAWVVITLANFFLSPIVWSFAVTKAFKERRGFTIGLVLSGNGIANFAVPLFLVWALTEFGWRGAYFALAAAVFVICGAVLWLLFRMPKGVQVTAADESTGETGMTAAQAMRTSRYWRLALVIFLGAAAVGALNVHLQPMLIDRGATILAAAGLAAAFGPAQIVGRLLGGYLLDKIPGTLLGFVVFLLPAVSCGLILAGMGLGPLAIIVPTCIGFAAGVELDIATYMAGRYFGRRHFGAIFSVLFVFFIVGYTVAPLGAAYIRDVTGDYRNVLLAICAMLPVTAILCGTLGRYPDGSASEPHA